MADLFTNAPENDAHALMMALQNEQALLERDLPEDSKVVATAVLTTGDKFQITQAYALGSDVIVFRGTRDNKSIRVITRYSLIAQCEFQVEKGKRDPLGFHIAPPALEP